MPTARRCPTIGEDMFEAIAALQRRFRTCAWKGRIALLTLLVDGPKEVSALAAASSLHMSTTSRHLKAMRSEGLLTCRRERTRQLYALSDAVRVHLPEGQLQLMITASRDVSIVLVMPAAYLRPSATRTPSPTPRQPASHLRPTIIPVSFDKTPIRTARTESVKWQ
jgi:DNA-binding transcriptional ArsR family regulator